VLLTKDKSAVSCSSVLTFSRRHGVLRLESIFNSAFFSLVGSTLFITKDKSAVSCSSILTFSWRHGVLRLESIFNSAFFSLVGSTLFITKDKSAVSADACFGTFCGFGAPGRTRTCNPRLRRPVLYPVELRALSN
jgi:hypothetical protein